MLHTGPEGPVTSQHAHRVLTAALPSHAATPCPHVCGGNTNNSTPRPSPLPHPVAEATKCNRNNMHSSPLHNVSKNCTVFFTKKNELKFHGGLDEKAGATHARLRRRPGQERPIGKSRVGSFRFSMCSCGPCKKKWHRSSFQMLGLCRSGCAPQGRAGVLACACAAPLHELSRSL